MENLTLVGTIIAVVSIIYNILTKLKNANLTKELLELEDALTKEKEFVKSFVEEVHLYEKEQEDGRFLKHIKFKFPVFFNGTETQELDWDNESTVETVALLSRKATV